MLLAEVSGYTRVYQAGRSRTGAAGERRKIQSESGAQETNLALSVCPTKTGGKSREGGWSKNWKLEPEVDFLKSSVSFKSQTKK